VKPPPHPDAHAALSREKPDGRLCLPRPLRAGSEEVRAVQRSSAALQTQALTASRAYMNSHGTGERPQRSAQYAHLCATLLHANGLPFGVPSTDSPYAGTGTYTPHVIARNLTGSPQSITPTLEYPGASGATQSPLAPLTLAPYATMDIPFDPALAVITSPVPHAAIGIQYSGAPGSVIADVASIEQKGELAVSSYVENTGNNFAGSGAHAWHLDAQTESILYLSNLGNQECPIGMRVQANGVAYFVTDVRLKAHETRAISLRQLRDAQKTDFQGHKIPADATDGSVLWARLKNLPVTGTLDVVSDDQLVTPEASGSCCCPANYQGLSLAPGDPDVLVGDPLQYSATLATMDCNGNYYYATWTNDVTWNSSDKTVANFQTSGNPSLLSALTPGTTNVIANGSCWEQYMCCAGVCNPAACVPVEGGSTVNVVAVSITGGNNYVLWGSDPNILIFNEQQAAGTPSGGQYAWSASNSKVSFNSTGAALVTLTAQSPSASLLDTQLIVNYTYNNFGATPATRYITVRIYKFLQQSGQVQVVLLNGPSQYGYNATAYYNIYTNPGGQSVPSDFSNVPIFETVTINSVTPSGYSVTLHQGAGATYADSEIHDNLSVVTTSPLPSNLDINASQDISVSGIYVRSNTLNYMATGPVITNNGPFN